ncbi:MAG: hypothetical protein ACKVOM_01220 [Ferruginibacter sp.]
MSEILDFVNTAKNDGYDPLIEFFLGNVPNFQAMSIIAECDVDLRGCRKIINAYGVNHAIKRHGNDREEAKYQQVGLVDSDFQEIPLILSNPDKFERGKDTNRGNPVLKFYKKIKNKNYTVVMTYFKGGRKGAKLEFDTMYIKK